MPEDVERIHSVVEEEGRESSLKRRRRRRRRRRRKCRIRQDEVRRLLDQ